MISYALGLSQTRERSNGKPLPWSCALNPLALVRRMHRFPQVGSPLLIELEIRTVAEHAGENERGHRRHLAVAAASAPWVRPIGFMNSSTRISSVVGGLRFVINMACLSLSRDCLRRAIHRYCSCRSRSTPDPEKVTPLPCNLRPPVTLHGVELRILKIRIFPCLRRDSGIYPSPSRPTEGRIRIVRDAGRDAVDAAALGVHVNCRAGFGLSQTRERSTARRRTMLLRTVKPCGPGTRCWCQAGGGVSARPGADMPLIRWRW
jgi:hypothetical protein